MLKICKYCGKEFDTNRKNQVYCSDKCLHSNYSKMRYEKIKVHKVENPVNGKTLEQWGLLDGSNGERLLKEYSDKNPKPANKISAGSKDYVIWKCSKCGHEWSAILSNRTQMGRRCPVCSGSIASNKNNFLQWCKDNGELGNKLMAEYSSKNTLKMDEITPFSDKKFIWKCSICEYEWEAIIRNRTRLKQGCPACANQVATDKNNLATWCKENGLYGNRIFNEYSEKNNLKIDEILPFGSYKALWKCSKCGFEWKAFVKNRTIAKTGCPKCSKSSTSFGEQVIYYVLRRELPNYTILNREKVLGFEVDILIEKLKLGIEYSGYIHHKNRIEQDNSKIRHLKDTGYNIIVILEYSSDNDDIENIYYNFAVKRQSQFDVSPILEYLKKYLIENYNLSIDIKLTLDEIEECRKRSCNTYIDIDEIYVLKGLGKTLHNIADMFNCNYSKILDDIRKKNTHEYIERESDIQMIIAYLMAGYTTEEIASNSVEADTSIFEFDVDDKTYDLDFVLKIKSLLEKYKAI